MTLREIIYLCLDEVKGFSDDFNYTEEHILFLITKYRSFLLKQRYSDIRKHIPSSNYQEICIDLEPYSEGPLCTDNVYLRSIKPLPNLMSISNPIVSPMSSLDSLSISNVSIERFKHTGHNKYLQNIIYSTVNTDNHLYLKSTNPQFIYIRKVKLYGIFDDFEATFNMSCTSEDSCDIMDMQFPLESALVPPLIELVVKELVGAIYRPEDNMNNAKDDTTPNNSTARPYYPQYKTINNG